MSLLEFCSSAVNTRHFIIFNYGGFSYNIFSLSSIFFNNPFILLEVKCKYKWLSDWRAALLGSGIRRILDLKIRVQQNQQNHRASRCKCSCGLSQIQGGPTCFSALAVLSISAVIKEHFNILWENIWTHSSWCANTTVRKQKHGGSRSPVSVLIQAFRQRCDIWKEHSEQQENGLYYTAESQSDDRNITTSTATKIK